MQLTFTENATVGQMHPIERKLIYDVVRKHQPEICVECGTWMGGGSTFFISNALVDNGKGKLYTWETDVPLYNQAVQFYADKPTLKAVIEFNNSDFLAGVQQMSHVDFALLDGPDIPEFTIDQFFFLNTIMPKGSNIIMHDWNVEKCSTIKPILRKQTLWQIMTEINDTTTGMCWIQKT